MPFQRCQLSIGLGLLPIFHLISFSLSRLVLDGPLPQNQSQNRKNDVWHACLRAISKLVAPAFCSADYPSTVEL
jgi:hypothetical protein